MAKEKLPVSFLTDFVSRSWEDIGYLKETIRSIGENFSGTKKVEELLEALLDAYLVCVGQLELHLADKDYLDIPDEAKEEEAKEESLKEELTVKIDGPQVEIQTSEDTVVAVDDEANKIMINDEGAHLEDKECVGPDCDVPPVVNPVEPIEVPAEVPANEDPFAEPFEFDAPEAENVRQYEKPDVTDYFVDFDDPVGEPVTEKDLYGEDSAEVPGETLDDLVKDEEKKDEE